MVRGVVMGSVEVPALVALHLFKVVAGEGEC